MQYQDAAHGAYARLVAAQQMPRPIEDEETKRRRQRRERANAMIRRRLPRAFA